jgi:hypothetical protein
MTDEQNLIDDPTESYKCETQADEYHHILYEEQTL